MADRGSGETVTNAELEQAFRETLRAFWKEEELWWNRVRYALDHPDEKVTFEGFSGLNTGFVKDNDEQRTV